MRYPATAALCALVLSSRLAAAQSCLGHPALPTGPINISTDVAIGSDFGGLGFDLNVGKRKSGPFGGVGFGITRFVTDPRETRLHYGALAGWERYNKDQLIFCPFVSGAIETGQEVDFGNGLQKTNGTIFGIGMAVGFEQERRGPLSFNPYISARLTRLNTKVTGAVTRNDGETGTSFSAGLGVRFNDAIQITPNINASTFEGSNMVFDIRFSLALQFRRQQ